MRAGPVARSRGCRAFCAHLVLNTRSPVSSANNLANSRPSLGPKKPDVFRVFDCAACMFPAGAECCSARSGNVVRTEDACEERQAAQREGSGSKRSTLGQLGAAVAGGCQQTSQRDSERINSVQAIVSTATTTQWYIHRPPRHASKNVDKYRRCASTSTRLTGLCTRPVRAPYREFHPAPYSLATYAADASPGMSRSSARTALRSVESLSARTASTQPRIILPCRKSVRPPPRMVT